jgi:hypothetical protein
MARKKGNKKKKFTIPLAPMIGLAAGLVEPAIALSQGQWWEAINGLKYNYLGIDAGGNWNPWAMQKGLAPLIIGLLIHKFVGGAPLNLNKTLAASGVPFIRI